MYPASLSLLVLNSLMVPLEEACQNSRRDTLAGDNLLARREEVRLEEIPPSWIPHQPRKLGIECTKAPCKEKLKAIQFWIIGDWGGGGGEKKKSPTTEGQLLCAKFIENTGRSKDPHFFISTGDNIYQEGVDSVDDKRFNTTFDEVFTYGKEQNIPIPWYLTLGNHDWFRNPGAQLEYTNRNPRWVSPRFNFKVNYDAHPGGGPTVEFIFIDTVILCGNTRTDEELTNYVEPELKLRKVSGVKYKKPAYPDAAKAMWRWLEQEMKASKADYLFIVGHYPAFEKGKEGISPCLVPKLAELLETYRATAYLAGHAHTLEHVTTERGTDKNKKTMHHILSGAGSGTEYGKLDNFYDPNEEGPNWNPTLKYYFPPAETGREGKNKNRQNEGGMVYAKLGRKTGDFEFHNCDETQKHEVYKVNVTSRNNARKGFFSWRW